MKRRIPLILTALVLGLAATFGGGAPQAAAAPNQIKYAALGDSFAAGSTIDVDYAPGRTSIWCDRTEAGYPVVVADDQSLSLSYVACSGATTADILGAQRTATRPVPPQTSALNNNTKVVTLTIGGNDVGFGALASCFGAAVQQRLNPADVCASFLDTTVFSSKLVALGQSLGSALMRIHEQAPNAKILVSGYPIILGPLGGNLVCSSYVLAVFAVNNANTQLNEAIAQTVGVLALSGMPVTYVDVASSFAQHGYCEADSWIGPTLHPSIAGQQAYAAAFEAAMETA